jgi:hypothetical protein
MTGDRHVRLYVPRRCSRTGLSRSVQSFHREAPGMGLRRIDTDTIVEIVQFNSAHSSATQCRPIVRQVADLG